MQDRIVQVREGQRLLISVPEAAQLLSVSKSFTYELVASGALESVQLGRRVLVPVGAIDRLIASGGTKDDDDPFDY